MSCPIYGRETVRYTYNYTDIHDTIQTSTLDWSIEDVLLSTTDNTTILTDVDENTTQIKVYETAGTKSVHCEIDFDNGWGDIYQHETDLTVEAKVYEAPVLGFSWAPVEPTIVDNVVFTQVHDDTRDMLLPKRYGWIDTVKVDHYNDGTWEEEGIAGDAQFSKIYEVKQDGIQIELVARYWDGYEFQETELTKTMNMSNIPPVADYSRQDNGVCVPAYVWTATSTDMDEEDTLLEHNWWLYEIVDGSDVQLNSGSGLEFSYPFQYEGNYKVILRTTDEEGDWTEKVDEFPITFSECSSSGGISGGGVIRIESNRFEMISIPVTGQRVADYFLAKVEEVTGLPASETIEFVKAYPSNTVSSGKYLGFVPGVTNLESSSNFKLVEDDNGKVAHVPFFVRSKAFDSPDYVIEIEWDTGDAI